MRVFISHAASDHALAREFARKLSREGLDVWDQDEEVLPGDNWASKMGEALAKSDVILVLLSPDSVESTWVRHEIEYAISSERLQNRLLPVVVRPTEKIPWILERLQLLRIEDDPIAGGERVVERLKQMTLASPPGPHGPE